MAGYGEDFPVKPSFLDQSQVGGLWNWLNRPPASRIPAKGAWRPDDPNAQYLGAAVPPANPLAGALMSPTPTLQLPPLSQMNAPEPALTGSGTSMATPVAPAAYAPAPTAAAQPGVQVADKGRPGIRTTIYRHNMEGGPAQREYIFDESGLEIPGARARLEDRLAYNQQLMDAMQQAGGSLQNSPQFAGLAAQNESGWKTLGDQMSAQAQMTDAGARQSLAEAEYQKSSPDFLNKSVLLEAAKNNPALFNEPGYQQGLGLPKTMADLGVDKAASLKEGVNALQAHGIPSVQVGDPYHAMLASKFGNELQGARPWWKSSSYLDPAAMKRFVLPAAAAAPEPAMAAPIQRIGIPRTAHKRPAVFRGLTEPPVRFGNQDLIR